MVRCNTVSVRNPDDSRARFNDRGHPRVEAATDTGAAIRQLEVVVASRMRSLAVKLAILVHRYRTLEDGMLHRDPGAAAYDAQHPGPPIRPDPRG